MLQVVMGLNLANLVIPRKNATNSEYHANYKADEHAEKVSLF